MTHLYPLLFEPVLKHYIWGGRTLEDHLGRSLPPGKDVAESWEIAAHPNGDVKVANGPYSGRYLSSLYEEMDTALVGTAGAWATRRNRFPLLIKLLDANRRLSVQVHPDDEYAAAHEGDDELGKSEMWVVLHADPGAAIILGVRPGTTAEALRQGAATASLEPYLHQVTVRTGDFVCVPAGTLHAILGGLLIAEIQQNSDTTYRVYDWGRTGQDGKPRPLHVDKALDVIDFDQVAPELPEAQLIGEADGLRRFRLCATPYFVVERFEMEQGAVYQGGTDGRSVAIWGAITGRAQVKGGEGSEVLPAVSFSLLPAALGAYTIVAQRPTTLLYTYLPA